MRPILLFSFVSLCACTSIVPSPLPLTGDWGGPHVGLRLDASGGQLDYDRAAGTIGPIVLAPDGRFTAAGKHTPGTGGPEIEGQPRPSFAASYARRVSRDRMTLVGKLANGVELGPFTLRRGAEPGIFRCL